MKYVKAPLLLMTAGALLVAASCTNNNAPAAQTEPAPAQVAPAAEPPAMAEAEPAPAPPEVNAVQYADVLKVTPVNAKEQIFATVIGSEALHETGNVQTPHEVCEDVVVQDPAQEKKVSVGGTAAGAVIGGVLGNQVGKGDGRKAATVAGAVVGGVIGNKVGQNQAASTVGTHTEQQCHTETTTTQTSKITGYNVTYRTAEGTTGTLRTDSDKQTGSRIALGSANRVQGYDVTYRFNGMEKTIRMSQKPASDRLPVIDGKVMTAAQ
jgi:uncharacterized protein YcfJ